MYRVRMEEWSPRTKLKYGLCTEDEDGNIVSVWNFGELDNVLNEIDSDVESAVGGLDCEHEGGSRNCPVCLTSESNLNCRCTDVPPGGDCLSCDMLIHILCHASDLDMPSLESCGEEVSSNNHPLESVAGFDGNGMKEIEHFKGITIGREQQALSSEEWHHSVRLSVQGGLPYSYLEVMSHVILLCVFCIAGEVQNSTWLELLQLLFECIS